MKTTEQVQHSISDLERNAKLFHSSERRKAEKEAKKYQEFKRILALPNAEEILRRDLERLEASVTLTDKRWDDHYSGNNRWKQYMVPNNPNATENQRRAHHHAQYGYGSAKRKIQLIKELLEI